MKRIMMMVLIVSAVSAFAQDCGVYKARIDSLMAEFDAIKEKMSDPGISREEYDDLYTIYTDYWSEIVENQKEQKKCIESQKKIVTVKVEPKKVDSDLPKIFSVPWGTSRIKAKEALAGQKDMKVFESDESVLEYRNGSHLGFSVSKWQFSFTSKKLYACQIIFSEGKDKNPLKLYDEISRVLTGKYGEPSYEKNKFPSSYKSDKIKLSAIKNGSVSIYNKWLFRKDDILRIGINENGDVMMTYLVESLHKKVRQ